MMRILVITLIPVLIGCDEENVLAEQNEAATQSLINECAPSRYHWEGRRDTPCAPDEEERDYAPATGLDKADAPASVTCVSADGDERHFTHYPMSEAYAVFEMCRLYSHNQYIPTDVCHRWYLTPDMADERSPGDTYSETRDLYLLEYRVGHCWYEVEEDDL